MATEPGERPPFRPSPDEAPTRISQEAPNAASFSAIRLLPGVVVQGVCTIEKEIARGGMGIVFKAVDASSQQPVVVKALLADIAHDEQYKKRFVREAEEWVNLGKHPNIVRCHSILEFDYSPLIIAEYVEGGSLHDYIRTHPSNPRELLNIAVRICHGMAYAHARNIVHRDLKPANILLSADREPKISDFGLVKRQQDNTSSAQDETAVIDLKMLGENWLMTLGAVGTPEYIAPEQWLGEATTASDVYAFGVILYELFSAQRPFDHPTLQGMERITALRKSHLQEPPPPLPTHHALPAGLTPGLTDLIRACLAKQPAKRPGSFTEIAAFLNQLQESHGFEPTPEPPSTQLAHEEEVDRAYGLLRLGHDRMFHGDNSKAFNLAQQAHLLFQHLNHHNGLGDCQLLFSSIAYNTSDFLSSLQHAENCLQNTFRHDDHSRLSDVYFHLGRASFQLGNYESAMDHRLKSLEYARLSRNAISVSRAVSTVGLSHYAVGRYQDAERCFEESLRFANETNALFQQAGALLNLGNIKSVQKAYTKAMSLYERALQLARTVDAKDLASIILSNMGRVWHKQGKLREARSLLQQALEIKNILGDQLGMAQNYATLGEIYAEQGKRDDATRMLQQALRIGEQIGSKRLVSNALFELGKLCRAAGATREAGQLFTQSLAIMHELKLPYSSEVEKALRELGELPNGEYPS